MSNQPNEITGKIKINGIVITMRGSLVHDMANEELTAYVDRGLEKYGKRLRGIEVQVPEDHQDMVDIRYDLKPVPFQRLRRITGYLVGDLSRWNDGKRAEEHDRVKHEGIAVQTENGVEQA